MKIICLKENLKESLSITERVVGKSLSLPILSNFHLDTVNGLLKISATDLEIGIDVWTNCKIEKEGEILIPAKLFVGVINNLPESKITLETKDTSVVLTDQNHHVVIVGSDSKEFPSIPKIEDGVVVEFEAQPLRSGFLQVLNSAAASGNRVELNSVFMKKNKDVVKIATTDIFRLAEKTIFSVPSKGDFSILIPIRTVSELVRILENKEKVSITVNSNHVVFETQGVRLFSRLIEGNFPDYNQVVPKQHETEITVEKQDFIDSIHLVGLFSEKDKRISIKISNKKIELSARSSSQGETRSILGGEVKGGDIEVGFNYQFLLDGLSNLPSGKILFKLNSSSAAALISPGLNDYFYLVMPMRNY